MMVLVLWRKVLFEERKLCIHVLEFNHAQPGQHWKQVARAENAELFGSCYLYAAGNKLKCLAVATDDGRACDRLRLAVEEHLVAANLKCEQKSFYRGESMSLTGTKFLPEFILIRSVLLNLRKTPHDLQFKESRLSAG